MSPKDYVELLRGSQPPSQAQIEDFAQFVAEAHSWYKHLPQVPPGEPFVFFLNPFAGCDIIAEPDRRYGHRERVGDSGFHYSWMPTADYRRRFGHLDYHCAAGTKIFHSESRTVSDYGARFPVIATGDGTMWSLPPEVVAEGTVEVTGMVHPRSGWVGLYERFPNLLRDPWPDECGGQELRQRVMQRIDEVIQNPQLEEALSDRIADLGIDAKLSRLLEPERLRQRAGLVAAMHRACRVVYGSPG